MSSNNTSEIRKVEKKTTTLDKGPWAWLMSKVSRVLDITAKFWPDKLYLTLQYRLNFGRWLNWENPLSFNEKLNWEKLYNHNPLYNILADKHKAKEYVGNIIGKEHIVPSYGVWKTFDEIDFTKLPKQFVLKTSHDSSGATICTDKDNFDHEAARKKLELSLKRNWYSHLREWVYKDIEPVILADKYLDDHSGTELRDYKFWCFNGEPKVMYLTNKGEHIIENFYDMDFNPLQIDHGFERQKPEFDKPEAFEEMKALATKISKDIPFVRVDFFYVDGVVYFGECTFYDWGGMRPFKDYETDLMLGSWMDISKIKQ